MGGYKRHDPTVYVVIWDNIHVVKVGFTTKQRWRKFVLRGARLIALYTFEKSHDAFQLEEVGDAWLRANGSGYAFDSTADAAPYLGPDGGGYLECFRLEPELLESLLKHMLKHASAHGAKHCLEESQAMHATYATNATDERVQDLGENPRVPGASNPVDNSEMVRLAVAS